MIVGALLCLIAAVAFGWIGVRDGDNWLAWFFCPIYLFAGVDMVVFSITYRRLKRKAKHGHQT